MSNCPGCAAENPEQARFCSQCGGALSPAGRVGTADQPGPALAVVARGSGAPSGAVREFPAAPRVRRLAAAAIDLAIGGIFLLPLAVMPLWLEPFVKGNVVSKLVRFLPALYLLLRDSIGGRSVGKVFMGLVTYDHDQGRPATIVDSVVRNWPFAFPLLPWIGWMISACLSAVMGIQILFGSRTRLGDGFATTQVVDERHLDAA